MPLGCTDWSPGFTTAFDLIWRAVIVCRGSERDVDEKGFIVLLFASRDAAEVRVGDTRFSFGFFDWSS
jgi:hypothetical protein